MKHQELTDADKCENAYQELVEMLSAADWMDDRERRITERFFGIVASPYLHGRVAYSRNPTNVVVEQSNENLNALISYTIDEDTEDVDGEKKRVAHYRVYEKSMYEKHIPLTCGVKDICYIKDQIERINQDLILNGDMKETLSMRKMFMAENLKDSPTRHYEGQEEKIECLAEDFHALDWEYYETTYGEPFHTLSLRMKFSGCALTVVRLLDKPIDLPVLANLYIYREKYGMLRVPPMEIDESYLASHLSEFVNGELPGVVCVKYDEWDKEKDTPRFLKYEEKERQN